MNAIQKEAYQILVEFDRICNQNNISYSLAYGTLIGSIRHEGFIPWDDDVDIIMSRSNYERFIEVGVPQLNKNYTFVDRHHESLYWYGFGKIRSNSMELREKSCDYLGIHQGVWIDIFPYDAIPNDPVLAKKQIKKINKLHRNFVAFVFTHPTDSGNVIKKTVQRILSTFNRITKNANFMLPIWYDQLEHEAMKYNNSNATYYHCLSVNCTDKEYEGSKLTLEQLENTILHRFEESDFPVIADYHGNLTAIYGDYMTPPPLNERVSIHDTV